MCTQGATKRAPLSVLLAQNKVSMSQHHHCCCMRGIKVLLYVIIMHTESFFFIASFGIMSLLACSTLAPAFGLLKVDALQGSYCCNLCVAAVSRQSISDCSIAVQLLMTKTLQRLQQSLSHRSDLRNLTHDFLCTVKSAVSMLAVVPAVHQHVDKPGC